MAPAVPRRRVDAAGRVRPSKGGGTAEPEARPAAYLENTVRVRQTVRHIDTWTVLRMSLIFYFLGLIVMLLAGVVLWNVATDLGTIHSIDKSIKTLFDLKSFTLRPLPVLAYGSGFGVALMFLGTIINVLASVLFNLIADVSGGVALFVVAEPDHT